MKISTFIKEKREAKGLSKYKLGKLTGFTAQYIYSIERGLATPSLERLEIICKVLGVEYVVGRKE